MSPSTNNNHKIPQEDEIDLRELFGIIARKKILIATITSVITLGAIFYAYSKTPIYEVKSNIQVGFIDEILIDEPDTLVKKLNIIFNVEDKISTKDEYVSEVTSISTNKNLKNFIEIKTEAISNEEALKKNQKVVTYVKKSYRPKIEQYVQDIKNEIENTKRKISLVENFETNNVKEQIKTLEQQTIFNIDEKIKKLQKQDIQKLEQQIKLLRTQTIVDIDVEIKKLKEQNIKKLEQQIKLLQTQTIIELDEKINFIEKFKTRTIQSKIDFHTKKLDEYTQAINKLYNENQNNLDSSVTVISSIQMVNYQNLILSSQNQIEDFKTELEIIATQTIPNLKIERKNISDVSIKDLQLQIENIQNIQIEDLMTKKKNINDITIKDLQLQIENIKNITIPNLHREKEITISDTKRKLQHAINVDLVSKKTQLNEKIMKLKYNLTEQNVKNCDIVGDYVVHDYAVKPKKKLIVVVAFITGLILSIFLVFFLNFIRNESSESRDLK